MARSSWLSLPQTDLGNLQGWKLVFIPSQTTALANKGPKLSKPAHGQRFGKKLLLKNPAAPTAGMKTGVGAQAAGGGGMDKVPFLPSQLSDRDPPPLA